MATLQTLVDRIQSDYLNKSNLSGECVRAIQAAIRHYERQRFPWNETATALACVSSLGTVAVPTDLMVLDLLQISAQGVLSDLTPRPFDYIKLMNVVPTYNTPTHFAIRGNNFNFAAIPDSAYPLTCYYLNKLPELTATSMTGTNDWLANAEDLLVYHAAKLMWANVLRNDAEAMKMFALEKAAYVELSAYNDQRMHGRLRATRF